MTSRFALLLGTLAVLAAVINSHSQVRIMRSDSTGSVMRQAGNMLQLRELGALISPDKDHLRVDHVMSGEKRPAAYADVDLKEGDVILMANAQRVKDIAALKGLYEGTKTGETFRMGIRRDDAVMLVSFIKADPKDLPVVRMQVISGGDGGEVEALPALGLIIAMKGAVLEVLDIVPGGAAPKAGARKGDIVLGLNGKKADTVKGFVDAYDSLPTGGNVTLKLDRGGKPLTFTFSKPVPGDAVIQRDIK